MAINLTDGSRNPTGNLTDNGAFATDAELDALPRGSAFSQGLRSGLTAAGGQLRALAGNVGETFGADDFAKEQYAKSLAAQQEAAAEGPRINSYKQVHGLRDAYDYATGLVGQSVPVLGAGLAGALVTRGRAPLVGATGATAPFEIGSAIERQQADPEAMKHSAGERLATAATTGVTSAAIQNLVPVAMGSKLAGRVAENAAAQSIKGAIAKNAVEAVGGNALAGAASEKIHQLGEDYLNPNRDSSGDIEALKEAAIGGATMGLPFGAMGATGDVVHSRMAKTPGGDLVSRTKALFEGKNREPIDLQEARKIAADEELVTPDQLHGLDTEQAGKLFEQSDMSRTEKAAQWAKDLFENGGLDEEQRAKLATAATDLSDRANQAVVAGMKVASDLGRRASDKVADLYKSVAGKTDEGVARNEQNAGIRQQVASVIAPIVGDARPELFNHPTTSIQLIDSVSRVVEKARADGNVSDVVMAKLQNILGDKTRQVLTAVHDRFLQGGDTAGTDNFYKAMSKLADEEIAHRSLEDAVRSSLKPELAEKATPEQIREAVQHIKEFISEQHTANMTAEQAKLHKLDVHQALQDHFGDKTDALLNKFAEDVKKNMKATTFDDRAPVAEAEHSTVDAADQYDQPQYYGKGKDSQGLVQSEALHQLTYGNDRSPARDMLEKARRENPDRNVSFVEAKDLPADHPGRVAHEAAGLPLDDHGIIVAEGMKQEGRLTPEELGNMRLDTSKTSHLKNPSRIDTGVHGVTLDAKRVASQMGKKLPFNEMDDKSGQHRLARTFMEGIAAAQDHLGKAFDVKDDVVVASRAGKDITWGDLKKLEFSPEHEIDGRVESNASLGDLQRRQSKVQLRMDDIERAIAPTAAREKAGEKLTPTEKAKLARAREMWAAERRIERALQEAIDRRDENARLQDMKDTDGKMEVAPDEQIHAAAMEHGDKVARHADSDGNAIQYDTKGGGLVGADGSLSDNGRRALDTRLNSLEQGKSAIARKLAEKGRMLEGKIDAMSSADQMQLARVIKEKDTSAAAQIINRLAEKYKDAKPVAKESKEAAIQKAIKEFKGDPVAAYDLITKSGQDRLASNQKTGSVEMSATDQKAVKDHIEKVLGNSVKVELAKILHAGEFERVNGEDIIRASVFSLDPMGVAHHESLHAFFQQLRDSGDHEATRVLYKAADTGIVKNQLRKLLAHEPGALKQIENSAEERVAYMYQFWAKGDLKLGEKANHMFTKIADFFRKVLGTWSNDERALHILNYFHSGEYAKSMADRSAVSLSLEQGTNKTLRSAKKMAEPLAKLSSTLFSVGDARLRDTNNPALVKLADLIHSQSTGEAHDAGFITASRAKRTQVMNDLAASLKDINAEHLQAALESLQTKAPAANPEARIAARTIRGTLDHMFEYMREAGVNVGDLGYGKDYFPRVWDASYISSHQKEFTAMVQKYIDSGDFKGSTQQLMARLMRQEGSEVGIETSSPGMSHVKERKLDFIRPEDAAPFLNKDLYQTLNSYVTQASRRAEWARRFDDTGAGLRSLLKEAKEKHGATDEQIRTAEQYVKGVDGTLGDDINPTMRKAFGNMIVYQNVRLLPLAIFSSIIDPQGIIVRGGTVGDAWTTFKRGVKEMTKNFQKDGGKKDASYQLAEDLGVIDNAMLMHTIGSSYSMSMMGDTAKKINDTFFRYNLMEQFNTSMRVGATEAAVKFLAKHNDGAGEHSERWLAELGLKPGEMVIKDGRPLLREQEFLNHGMKPEQAAEMANKMSAAVNKWVDGAVLRPNAATKPIWMNDPHFALFAHLKQFTYSFQETIIKRVMHEAQHGNYTPAMALASYVPVMMAADLMKGMIQGGGNQPDWKDGWGVDDYVWSGVQRAGLLGVGQFGVDAATNIHRGGLGIGALTGPTIEQLGDAVHVVGGHGEASPFLLKSMPANALYAQALGGQATDPTFAD